MKRSLRVVYIDDEIDMCSMFADNFSNDNFKILTFVDSELGLKDISETTPDLVLLDYRMPKMTGDLVAKVIGHDIPVAMLTGDLSIPTSQRYVRIFGKPYSFEEMENFLSSFLEDKNSKFNCEV